MGDRGSAVRGKWAEIFRGEDCRDLGERSFCWVTWEKKREEREVPFQQEERMREGDFF